MSSASALKQACPGCRAQLLNLLEHGFGVASSAGRLRPQRLAPLRSSLACHSRLQKRTFATTKTAHQTDTPNTKHRRPEDIEAFVRQAKVTFGNTLPANYLTEEEYKLYERLFGPPLRETRPEDLNFRTEAEEMDIPSLNRNDLLRELEDGTVDVVDHQFESTITSDEIGNSQPVNADTDYAGNGGGSSSADGGTLPAQTTPEYVEAVARDQREYDALMRLRNDFEIANALAAQREADAQKLLEEQEEEIEEEEEVVEEEEEEEIDDQPDAQFEDFNSGVVRLHELTKSGTFKTEPRTLQLPKVNFVEPITTLLKRTDKKHIKEAAESAFGGRWLPFSPATHVQVNNQPQKAIPLTADQSKMSDIEADTYLATVMPGVYASTLSVLTEVRKRLGSGWLRGLLNRRDGRSPRVLDAGAGGAAMVAWNQVLQAEWEAMDKTGFQPKRGKNDNAVVVGSRSLRERITEFLHDTSILPRLPDYANLLDNPERLVDGPDSTTSTQRKNYDVIIATHTLMPLGKAYQRRHMLDNLWALLNPNGGVLIVLEKGHPRGFEAVADLRQRILDEYIVPPGSDPSSAIELDAKQDREPGMIIAPCTNHSKCPMYLHAGLSPGRKDFCRFNQRFIRPDFLQNVLGKSDRNHEDIQFSYVAVQRGQAQRDPFDDIASPARPLLQGKAAADAAFKGYEVGEPPNMLSLPRAVLPPLKHQGHVTLDMCTPEARIERWIVPRSFSQQAYHDARKARWGDLWALGAKTRTPSRIRLGRGVDADAPPVPSDGGVRSYKAARSHQRKKNKIIEVQMRKDGSLGATERPQKGYVRPERRTKGGRKPKYVDLIKELEEGEEEDEREERSGR